MYSSTLITMAIGSLGRFRDNVSRVQVNVTGNFNTLLRFDQTLITEIMNFTSFDQTRSSDL